MGTRVAEHSAPRRADPMEAFNGAPNRARSPLELARIARAALALVWRASRRGFLMAVAYQLVGAASATLLVLAGKLALDAVLEAERDAPPVGQLVPVIVLVAVVTAINAAAGSLQTHQERLVGQRTSSAVWERLLDVSGGVDLEFFESPIFFERLKRIELNALLRPLLVTTGVFGLVGGAAGTVGIM
ncbi:MAG TPA: hypothetical protein VMZ00_06745, partial [Sporichthya sp.]|nr:hypothetical protein [Sporichthya sp.]